MAHRKFDVRPPHQELWRQRKLIGIGSAYISASAHRPAKASMCRIGLPYTRYRRANSRSHLPTNEVLRVTPSRPFFKDAMPNTKCLDDFKVEIEHIVLQTVKLAFGCALHETPISAWKALRPFLGRLPETLIWPETLSKSPKTPQP